MAEHPWFEIEDLEEDDLEGDGAEEDDLRVTPIEQDFLDLLKKHTEAWATPDVGSGIDRLDDEETLLVCLSLRDPVWRLGLVDFGVHLRGNRVRGDRLHSRLYSLPDEPTGWALDTTGTNDELARATADWMRAMLRRPLVLYAWVHDGRAYAARFLFADDDETLCQLYEEKSAPPGQTAALRAAGQVRGKGWIQTRGLPAPDFCQHVRGDQDAAVLPAGARPAEQRGAIRGVWYQ
ncbi:hypothetical protein [Streptomyces jumonjinensis]|uniref:hypothetical protein n=1 Tax=Streptomyces jumonjinensis TaxID=1945 RepID=UPI003790DA2F